VAVSSDVRRFAIRFSPWLLWLFWISGLGRPVRAWVAGFPIRLRRLALGLEDADGFIDALGVGETV